MPGTEVNKSFINARHQNTSVWSKNRSTLILCLLITAVTFFSLVFLSRQSLRLDEAQSLWQSSHTPTRTLAIIAEDVHMPLYALLLYFWQFFFGNEVALARIFSLFFFLLTIPAVYLLGKHAFNSRVGLFAAILVSASPFLNWYGSEIRMYSLLALLTVLNQYFFIRVFHYSRESADWPEKAGQSLTGFWWGYGITALVGVYTHYFFWFALLTQAIFYLIYRKRFPRGSFVRLASLAVLLLLAVAPWIYYSQTLGQSTNAQPLLIRPSSVNLFNTFSQFLFGFQNDHLNTIIVSLWPLSVLLGFLALRRYKQIPAETVYFFLGTIVPIIAAFFVSVTLQPLFLSRYLIFTVPSLFLFLSWFLSTYQKKLSLGFKGVLVALMLLTFIHQISAADNPVSENYRQASQYISPRATINDVIAVSPPFTIYPFEYYYDGPATVITLPVWDRHVRGPIPQYSEESFPEEVAKVAGERQNIWLILSYDQGYQEQVRLYFETHFQRIDQKEFSPGMTLHVYKLRYDTYTVEDLITKANGN